MLSRIARSALAVVTLTIPTALAACSSAPDEARGQSDEALLKCPLGYSLECETDESPTGLRKYCSCDAPSFADIATQTAGDDTCGTFDIPIPPALATHNCSYGATVDGLNIWACPVGTPVPSSLGEKLASGQPMPTCTMAADGSGPTSSTPLPCEQVVGFTSSPSNCIGTAPHGWMFIVDGVWIRKPINGGFAGQCAMPLPPLSPPPTSSSRN